MYGHKTIENKERCNEVANFPPASFFLTTQLSKLILNDWSSQVIVRVLNDSFKSDYYKDGRFQAQLCSLIEEIL